MLIHKIFHVRQSLVETQRRLVEAGNHLDALQGVKVASQENEVAHLELLTSAGFLADLRLKQLPGDNDSQLLFHSVGGNVELTGMVEFFPIREDLTEVELTMDYSIKTSMQTMLEAVVLSVDSLLNRQLRRVKTWLASDSPDELFTRAQRRHYTEREWQLAH